MPATTYDFLRPTQFAFTNLIIVEELVVVKVADVIPELHGDEGNGDLMIIWVQLV